MRAWLRKWRKHLLIAASVFAVACVIASYATWDYIQNDPKFCTSCHLMDDSFSRWESGPHVGVNCHTCHPGDMASNLHQLWMTVTRDVQKVEKHATVPAKICADCHLSEDTKGPSNSSGPPWKQVAATAGHALHYEQLHIECTTCHAPGIHEFTPTNVVCKGCHTELTVGLTPMEENHCTSCHNFLAPVEQGLRPRREVCGQCHTTSAGAAPALEAGWHEALECQDCHPVHDKRGDLPTRDGNALPCASCHEESNEPGPHKDCKSCHKPHEAPGAELTCRGCHDAQAAQLTEAADHQCTDCHQTHEPWAAPAERCADCHRDEDTLRRETPVAPHRECGNCHAPHESAAPRSPACASCHKAEAARAALAGPASHRACGSCHDVHRPERSQRCEGCHTDVAKAVAKSPPEHRDCSGCHPTHGPPRVGAGQCGSCHAKEVRAGLLGPPEHQRCTDCHDAHAPNTPRKKSCEGCHTAEVARLVGEPHDTCAECHTLHGSRGVAQKDCRGCHEAQAVTARKHAAGHACGDCHAGHDVKRARGCEGCHKPQAKAVAAAPLAVHRLCVACHQRPHEGARAGPTACSSCHGDADGDRGLHGVPGHLDCGDCHQSHGPRAPAAEACIRCHSPGSIRRHPPEAQGATRCEGCHNFRR